tara:strand:+ start:75 stop:422 length:348 start_codon:yes stop_codon:yes gene_type:complete
MAGSLSTPNKIKDVYTKLVWYNTTDSKFYRDNGSVDVEVPVGSSLVANNILKHETDATLSSGDIFQLINNGTEVFSVDAQGAVHLYPRTSAPTDNAEGTIYYDSTNDTLQVSIAE